MGEMPPYLQDVFLQDLRDLQTMRRVVSRDGCQVADFIPVIERQLLERRAVILRDLVLLRCHGCLAETIKRYTFVTRMGSTAAKREVAKTKKKKSLGAGCPSRSSNARRQGATEQSR